MSTPVISFAGHVAPQEAHALHQSGAAVMVDVRTDAERDWVGMVPGAFALSWKHWPGMVPNANFDAAVQQIAAAHPGKKLLFLCRSGVRSVAAAQRAAELGLPECYNILEGFEGDLDANQHRGAVSGWRFHGLPWVQK